MAWNLFWLFHELCKIVNCNFHNGKNYTNLIVTLPVFLLGSELKFLCMVLKMQKLISWNVYAFVIQMYIFNSLIHRVVFRGSACYCFTSSSSYSPGLRSVTEIKQQLLNFCRLHTMGYEVWFVCNIALDDRFHIYHVSIFFIQWNLTVRDTRKSKKKQKILLSPSWS